MLNVLLVDDEPWVLEGLKTMIDWSNYGFEVCATALNGADALMLIQEHQPELVFTDIRMPVFNGLELIEKSNRLLPTPPKFIILSGYDDFNYARTAMRQRVAGYLLKPIDDEEIEALLGKIGPEIREEIAARRNLSKQQEMVANHIMNRLLQGEYNPGLELKAGGLLKLPEDSDLQCVLLETVPIPGDIKARIKSLFPADTACIFEDNSGKTIIILKGGLMSESLVERTADQIHRVLAEGLNGQTIVAVSGKMKGVRSIRTLYLQAKEVGRVMSSQGKGGFYHFSQLKSPSANPASYKERLNALIHLVAAGNQEPVNNDVKELFASMAESQLKMEAVKAHVADLELTLCRQIADRNGDPDTFMNKLSLENGHWENMNDFGMLKNYVRNLCQEAAAILFDLKRRNESNTIYHVIQHVNRDFRGKMQLQDLAVHFHMNPVYLGQLFKKHTGKSFKEYVHSKRMEEAKRLLIRSGMKISDVAMQVGYSNTDYFINKFKAMTGVLPSVYKANFEKNEQI